MLVCAVVILASQVGLSVLSHTVENLSSGCALPAVYIFTGLMTAAFAAYFAVVYLVIGRRREGDATGWMIAAAVAFRLAALAGEPLFDDDIYRYIWDGKVTAHGMNPYSHAPEAVLLPPFEQMAAAHAEPTAAIEMDRLDRLNDLWFEHPGEAALFSRINYPDVSTIYPPVAQAVFAAAYAASPIGVGAVYGFKAAAALLDILTVLLLISVLRKIGADPLFSIIYAWNPLVIKEIAGTGHMESLTALLLMSSIYFVVARPQMIASGIFLGLAAATKLFPWVVLPAVTMFFWRRAGVRSLLYVAAAVATFCATYIPFLDAGLGLLFGARTYANVWEMNAGFFYAVKAAVSLISTTDGATAARTICLMSFVGLVLLVIRRCAGDERRLLGACAAITGGLFLLSPVQNPWYVCWFLPFVSLAPARHWIALSGTATFYYLYLALAARGIEGGPWGWCVLSIQALPFALLLIAARRRCSR